MKTLKKQWLEAVGAYQYALSFLLMGERSGRGLGAWGRHGEKGLGGERLELHLSGYPRAKGRGEDQNMTLEGGEEDPWMERLGFKS